MRKTQKEKIAEFDAVDSERSSLRRALLDLALSAPRISKTFSDKKDGKHVVSIYERRFSRYALIIWTAPSGVSGSDVEVIEEGSPRAEWSAYTYLTESTYRDAHLWAVSELRNRNF